MTNLTESYLIKEVKRMRDIQNSSYSKVRYRLGLKNKNRVLEHQVSNAYFLNTNFISN